MKLEKRLQELLENGNKEMADSLASGVLGSQVVADVELTATGVRVETTLFVGVHDISPSPPEIREAASGNTTEQIASQSVVIEPGEYQLKSDTVDYTVTGTNVHREELKEYLVQEFSVISQTNTKRTAAVTPNVQEPTGTTESANSDLEAQNTAENITGEFDTMNGNREATQMADGGVPQSGVSRFVQACFRRLIP